jgi:diadenosine tetraphosphate (Ap4A) HIT family hydrolase
MLERQSTFTTFPEVKFCTVAEDTSVFAFLANMPPITPEHSLVCPKRIIVNIEELTEQELVDVFRLAIVIKNALRKLLTQKDLILHGMKAKIMVNLSHIFIFILCHVN